MVRPRDQEIIAIEKTLCYSQFPRDLASHVMQGRTGKHLGQSEGRGSGENMGKGLYCGFHGKEWVRQSKQA